MRRLRPLLLPAVLALAGCYTYLPSSAVEVSPGQQVRIRLSAEEAARYQDLRLNSPRILEGTVVEGGTERLFLEASVGSNDPTRGSRALVQQLDVPFSGIVSVDLKELDKARTGLLVGGGAAALFAILLNAQGWSDRDPPGGGDIPEARRTPLIRFDFPVGPR